MSIQETKALATKTPNLVTADTSPDHSPIKRRPAPLKGGPRLSVRSEVEVRNRTNRYSFLEEIDAIACGVEAWFEETTGYSKRMMTVTVDIARTMGVPEDAIERWVVSQEIRNAEKSRVIKSLLGR